MDPFAKRIPFFRDEPSLPPNAMRFAIRYTNPTPDFMCEFPPNPEVPLKNKRPLIENPIKKRKGKASPVSFTADCFK